MVVILQGGNGLDECGGSFNVGGGDLGSRVVYNCVETVVVISGVLYGPYGTVSLME